MSHVFAPNEQLTKSLTMVVDNIYKRTNGAIEIQQYPQGQLATYKDGVEQVVQGAKFISVEDPSYLGDYVADFNALVGPMLYNNFDQYEYMIQTDLVKGMIKEVEEKHGINICIEVMRLIVVLDKRAIVNPLVRLQIGRAHV